MGQPHKLKKKNWLLVRCETRDSSRIDCEGYFVQPHFSPSNFTPFNQAKSLRRYQFGQQYSFIYYNYFFYFIYYLGTQQMNMLKLFTCSFSRNRTKNHGQKPLIYLPALETEKRPSLTRQGTIPRKFATSSVKPCANMQLALRLHYLHMASFFLFFLSLCCFVCLCY